MRPVFSDRTVVVRSAARGADFVARAASMLGEGLPGDQRATTWGCKLEGEGLRVCGAIPRAVVVHIATCTSTSTTRRPLRRVPRRGATAVRDELLDYRRRTDARPEPSTCPSMSTSIPAMDAPRRPPRRRPARGPYQGDDASPGGPCGDDGAAVTISTSPRVVRLLGVRDDPASEGRDLYAPARLRDCEKSAYRRPSGNPSRMPFGARYRLKTAPSFTI